MVLEYQSDYLTANTIYCLGGSELFEVHLLSRSLNNPYRLLPRVKSFHYFPDDKPESVYLDYIQQVIQRTGSKVLVPTNSPGVNFVIQHKDTLQQFIKIMPIPERWAYDIAADKGLLASFMLENSIPTPPTIFDLTKNLETALDDMVFPVLLKPSFGEGGYALTAEESPITEFKDKSALMSFIKERNIKQKHIIQRFIEGYVVGCNVLYQEGKLIAFTIQKSLTPTRPFAPSIGIEFIESEEAITIVDTLMSKLQWSGVANLDLIYDTQNQKLQILEINPRFWLTLTGSMVRANVNFPSLACQLALDQPIELAPYSLGKYIPLGTYIKYRLSVPQMEKVRFKWKEIDVVYFWKTLLSRAYRIYNEKIQKSHPNDPRLKAKVHKLMTQ